MAVGVFALPLLRFVDDSGRPLAGAKLWSYLAGTSTPAALYADHLGVTALTNPVIADAGGQVLIYGLQGQAYKLDLLDANDVPQGGWPVDWLTVTPAVTDPAQLLPVGFTLTATTVPLLGNAGAATLVGSGGLPAERLILLVQLTVTQQFGASLGAVSLALGDPGMIDRWGGTLTLTTGVKPMRNGGMPMFPTATDLVLSLEGGAYDGTGQAHAVVYSMGIT